MDRFHIKSLLGRGSYGNVYCVERKEDGKAYVLKKITTLGMTMKERLDAVKEVQIMDSLCSPHIVRYYESFLCNSGGDESLNIVMEYCNGGDLQSMLKKYGKPLPEDRVWKLFIQISLGLYSLHRQNILHRDIKTANIFLHNKDQVKIGDLGIARIMSTQTVFASTMIGTPYYLSPELVEDKPYNYKSDVWALGCVLYELCTNTHPFDAKNHGALILKIVQGKYPPISSYSASFSVDLQRLSKSMLVRDISTRPSVTDILSMKVTQRWSHILGIPLPKEVMENIEEEALYPNNRKQLRKSEIPPPSHHLCRLNAATRNINASTKGNIRSTRLRQPGAVRVLKDRNLPRPPLLNGQVVVGVQEGEMRNHGSTSPPSHEDRRAVLSINSECYYRGHSSDIINEVVHRSKGPSVNDLLSVMSRGLNEEHDSIIERTSSSNLKDNEEDEDSFERDFDILSSQFRSEKKVGGGSSDENDEGYLSVSYWDDVHHHDSSGGRRQEMMEEVSWKISHEDLVEEKEEEENNLLEYEVSNNSLFDKIEKYEDLSRVFERKKKDLIERLGSNDFKRYFQHLENMTSLHEEDIFNNLPGVTQDDAMLLVQLICLQSDLHSLQSSIESILL